MATLTVFQVNWGRHDTDEEFRAAATAVWWHFTSLAKQTDPDGAVAIALTCEVDEADPAAEHPDLAQIIGPDTQRVGWDGREPILVPARFDLVSGKVLPACRGVAGFTPTRTITEAVVDWPGTPLIQPVPCMTGHRPILRKATIKARSAFNDAFTRRGEHWRDHGRSYVYGLDPNGKWPALVRGEKVAIEEGGLGVIRYYEAPKGNRLALVETGRVPQHIDNHRYALWARFRVTPPA